MKRCATCHVEKPIEAFNRNGAKGDGRQNACRDCDNAASRAYYQANRKRHVAYVRQRKREQVDANRRVVMDHLLGHPCVDCGNADVRVLEFDHVTGTKTGRIAQMVATPVSTSKLQAEIAKCEVRCANCHRIRTNESLGLWRSLPKWANGKPTAC